MSEPLVAERRLAVVGAGPRGVMLLERILDSRARPRTHTPGGCASTSWTPIRPGQGGCGARTSPSCTS